MAAGYRDRRHAKGRPRRRGGLTRGGGGAAGSAGLAVRGVLAAARAELGQLEPVGVVPPVLLGDVVAFLALDARHGDLRADVLRLAGHSAALSRSTNDRSLASPAAGTARRRSAPAGAGAR